MNCNIWYMKCLQDKKTSWKITNWKRIHNQNQNFLLKRDLNVKIGIFCVEIADPQCRLLIFLVSDECLHVWLHSKDECPTCRVTDCRHIYDKHTYDKYTGWPDIGRALTFVGSFLCVSSSSRNHKFPGSQWCHALSLASCAVRCDSSRAPQREKGGAASA